MEEKFSDEYKRFFQERMKMDMEIDAMKHEIVMDVLKQTGCIIEEGGTENTENSTETS